MTAPFHKPVVCPVLIDRVSDLATLYGLIDQAKSGRGQVILLLAFFGQFGRGLAHAQRGLRIATEIDHQQWIAGAHSYLGQIYVLMLAPKEALRHLEVGLALARQLGSSWWVGNIVAYRALAYLLQGGRERAETEPADFLPSALLAEAIHDQTDGLSGGLVSGVLEWPHCPWGLGVELRGDKVPHFSPAEASPTSFGHAGASGCLA